MKQTLITLAFMLALSSVTITAEAATQFNAGIDKLTVNSDTISDKVFERRQRRKKCPNC